MEPFGDDHIAQLLRLKRYERPPPGYFENLLHEFHRRQRERDELLRQSLWRTCVDRVQNFTAQYDVRSLASYAAGIAAAVASAAVISITIYQRPDIHLAVQASPVPTRPPIMDKQLDFPPPVLDATFDMRPTLRPRSRGIPVLRLDPSNEFVPFNLQWESLDDQSVLEK